MKKIYIAVVALLCHCATNATTWSVTVANFSFNPATINAVVGDVIQFNWASGTHTTTCGSALAGTSLPAGAAEWNSPMTSAVTTFSYTVTVPGTYLYGCVPHFVSRAMQGTIVVSSVLPVDFGSFSILNTDNKPVLQWQTFTESNTDHFSIRRSTDATNFYEIGKVPAAGNSTLEKDYQFTDVDPGSNYKYLYYEITIVDKDKRESSSIIKTFKNNNITKDALIVSLSPNPITRPGMAMIKFNADKEGQMDVTVFNSSGQMVLKTQMAAYYGLNDGHVHVCDLAKGTYTVVFNLAGKKETKKIVVL